MPDGEQTESPARKEGTDELREDARPDVADSKLPDDPMFSLYGIASAVLGVLSVAAVVLGVFIWTGHREEFDDRAYLSRVMQTAAEWTGVLINMNVGNIDSSLQRLHDGTVGELNSDFNAALQPYRQVVEKLQTQSNGRIEGLAIETVHHDLDAQPGAPGSGMPTKLPPFATRTDSVMVIATSVAENTGTKPQTVHWNLRLDVSDVDGKLMISRLESIR